MKYFTAIVLIVCLNIQSNTIFAQGYIRTRVHSHNDYKQPIPFYTAYKYGAGSIEADIFLRNGELYVAHDSVDINTEKTLARLYLEPIREMINSNNGYAYADTLKLLLLLIDLKTAALPTLDTLVNLLKQYKQLTRCSTLKIVISGNRPASSQWPSYPTWIYFDGRPNEIYRDSTLARVALISDNFRKYSQWNGEGTFAKEDRKRIKAIIKKVHNLNKPIRFWASPDTPKTWEQLTRLKVDYINTDYMPDVSFFMQKHKI